MVTKFMSSIYIPWWTRAGSAGAAMELYIESMRGSPQAAN